ncbi:MAG: gerBA 4 [Symbiobacteriaceae bacterium]|nr:gerBA 4 [Symbiobacteriaceae bacterium]
MAHTLPPALTKSEQALRKALGASEDILFTRLTLRTGGRNALLASIEGMVNREALQEQVIEALLRTDLPGGLPPTLTDLGRQLLHLVEQTEECQAAKAAEAIFRGDAVLLVDGYAGALVLGTLKWDERPVQSAPSETGLRGPRDGFVERLTTNISLIRRRLNDPNLVVRFFRVGTRSKTRVAVLHMADITNERLVKEIEQRVAAIDYDGILDASQLRELLTGQVYTLFPKTGSTERPDLVVEALLAGKVAVLADNSPFALTAPITLGDTFWAADDYYTVPVVTLMMRLVRFIGAFATALMSPLYIGIMTFNPGLVRTDLAIYFARERSGIPLTPALEVLFLEVMMEVLHEATVRLPTKVGSAATVVGGLIIGQAAVEARLVSGIVVIVVAISALGSFTIPGQEMGQVWRATKWVLILAATTLGVYGVFGASFVLFSWLASQDSFGTPYLAPIAPLIPRDLLVDSVLRQHWSLFSRRERTYRTKDDDRTGEPQLKKYLDGGER